MIGSYAKNQFPPTIGHDPKFVAARLLSVHFSSDADVASELSSKIESTRHSYLAISAGVLAIS